MANVFLEARRHKAMMGRTPPPAGKRRGDVAARASYEARDFAHDARDRIVRTALYSAVVHD